jgi:hypothetical protein
MSAIRFFTDEDVYGTLAAALRAAGCDAVSTPEAGRLGESDELQLEWAADNGRTFVTFNVGHFAALHSDWIKQQRQHAGIVLSSHRSIGDMLRRLLHLAAILDASAMQDRLEFLSDW